MTLQYSSTLNIDHVNRSQSHTLLLITLFVFIIHLLIGIFIFSFQTVPIARKNLPLPQFAVHTISLLPKTNEKPPNKEPALEEYSLPFFTDQKNENLSIDSPLHSDEQNPKDTFLQKDDFKDIAFTEQENKELVFQPQRIPSNPLPKNPIKPTPLPPTPLERNTMKKKEVPTIAPQPKPQPLSKKPPQANTLPQPNSPSTNQKIELKKNTSTQTPNEEPSKTTQPTLQPKQIDKEEFLKKRAEKLKADKAAAEQKKIQKEETLKKNQEAQKKKENEEAEQARKQKLVSEAQKRMAKISSNKMTESENNQKKNALNSTPTPITSLEIDALALNGTSSSLSPIEMNYRDELANRLKLMLRLPEYGEVKLNLTLERSGKVVNISILNAESLINRKYIEKKIPELSFPAFGTHFESSQQYTFSITLSNE